MKIHPIIYIVSGLLGVSVGINIVQSVRIDKLKKEKYPIIIRRNIEFYEKPKENRVI